MYPALQTHSLALQKLRNYLSASFSFFPFLHQFLLNLKLCMMVDIYVLYLFVFLDELLMQMLLVLITR
jgi:hypothetical protein